jgi:hypothetical protein
MREYFLTKRLPYNAAIVFALSVSLGACSVVRTTADVAGTVVGTTVSATTAVVSTTASVAKTGAEIGLKVASTAASVGSATAAAGAASVNAASAAKSVSVATANTAIAGAALVGTGIGAASRMSREGELSHTTVLASAPDVFVTNDRRTLQTQGCDAIETGRPGLLVVDRDGKHEVRVSGGTNCTVLRIVDAN